MKTGSRLKSSRQFRPGGDPVGSCNKKLHFSRNNIQRWERIRVRIVWTLIGQKGNIGAPIPVVFPLQDETFLLQLKNIKSWATSRNEKEQGLRSWCQSKLLRRQSAKVNLVYKQNDYSSELQQKHRQHFFVFWKEERDVITVETKVSQTIMYFFSGVTIWVFEYYLWNFLLFTLAKISKTVLVSEKVFKGDSFRQPCLQMLTKPFTRPPSTLIPTHVPQLIRKLDPGVLNQAPRQNMKIFMWCQITKAWWCFLGVFQILTFKLWYSNIIKVLAIYCSIQPPMYNATFPIVWLSKNFAF